MEEGHGVSLHAKHGRNILRLLSAVGIYYGAARMEIEYVVQTGFIGNGTVQRVMQVWACKTHAEYILLPESQFLLYVIYYFGCGSGC